MQREASRRVARRWFVRLARYQEEFLQDVEGREFRNPETGNSVEFESLPTEEQSRVYESWSRSKKREESKETPKREESKEAPQERVDPEDEEDPGRARLAPEPDRYERLSFNVDGDGEKFLREVLGGDRHKERLLDASGLRSIGRLIENVDVEVTHRDDGTDVEVRGYGDHGIEFKRILSYERVGDVSRPTKIRNDQFMVDQDAPEGIGTRMLATQVLSAEAEGFREIETTAAGRAGTTWQGYYVWPRLGFDGEIEEDFLRDMPDDVRRDVDELADGEPPRFLHMMASPTGRQWWKENGRDVDVSFPLGGRQDNLSREVLFGYAREKAKKAGKPLGDYLSKMGSTTTKKEQKGDGMRLSKDDDKILDSAWDRVRKRLLEKKKGKPPGKPAKRS